jgi:hypothetical protein
MNHHPKVFSFFMIIFAAMEGMLYGYDIGILAGAFPFLNYRRISSRYSVPLPLLQ